jgi:hypothetical protein
MPFFALDEFGFPVARYEDWAVEQGIVDPETLIDGSVSLPQSDPGPGKKWRFVNGEWAQSTDNRGRYWYNPANTNQRMSPQNPEDMPPAGWIELLPGVDPVPAPGQLLAEAKVKARGQVNEERDRVTSQPITFDGETWDADARAVAAITTTLEELRGNPTNIPADGLFWITFGNGIRTFQNVPAFAQWLTRLAGAISARNRAAFRIAITRKQNVDSAQSVADVWTAATGEVV